MHDSSPPAGETQQKSSSFRLTAEANQWVGAALRGLPEGGSLAVRFRSDGEITVLLLDAAMFAAFPEQQTPLLAGHTDGDYEFSTVLPASGDYYLVFDNRPGTSARDIHVQVHAKSTQSFEQDRESYIQDASTMLSMVEAGLTMMFVFEPIGMRTGSCGTVKAFDESEGLMMCTEYPLTLIDTLRDKEQASASVAFALFQGLGRALLAQWSPAFQDRDEEIDEVATALMVMLGYQEHVRMHAAFFASDSRASELKQKLDARDRYTLTSSRAEKILALLENPEFTRDWQQVFVPNMQTNFLKNILIQAPGWMVSELVEREIAAREGMHEAP